MAQTVYVSGPMRGHENLNRGMFELAALVLRSNGYDVITPFDKYDDAATVSDDVRDLLLQDLGAIAHRADLLVTLPGWDQSNGATAEVAFATAIGVEVWELTEVSGA